MGLRADLTDEVGDIFTDVSAELEDDVTVKLLKVNEEYDEFDTVLEFDGKWFFEYSDFRKNFLLQIADDSDTMTAAMSGATHVQIDDDFYSIIAGDTTPPKSTDVTWKVYCDLFERPSRFSAL